MITGIAIANIFDEIIVCHTYMGSELVYMLDGKLHSAEMVLEIYKSIDRAGWCEIQTSTTGCRHIISASLPR